MNHKWMAVGLALLLGTGLYFSVPAEAGPPPPVGPAVVTWAPAVKPKPLTSTAENGLAWLIQHQHEDGGWGQGEESQEMGRGASLAEVSNVADTSISMLALIRAGNSPTEGPQAANLRRGVGFLCEHVEASDADSMQVSTVAGTRVQSKLGPHIDTFMAAMALAEVKGKMGDGALNKRVDTCLTKVLHKIEKNQLADGSWTREGWAPVLAQGMASKGLNRAAQAGATVSPDTLEKAQTYASTAPSGAGEGSAGVALYSTSSNAGALQDSVNTLEGREEDLKDTAANGPTEKERDSAKAELQRLDGARKSQAAARADLLTRLKDPGFVAGFGNNGGEEFLSYMNISESLVVKGGQEWEEWDQSMAKNLSKIQNPDGSWSGHHCITGRNFCTAAALLVLTADRAPVPIAKR